MVKMLLQKLWYRLALLTCERFYGFAANKKVLYEELFVVIVAAEINR